jgi:hypothetical protein
MLPHGQLLAEYETIVLLSGECGCVFGDPCDTTGLLLLLLLLLAETAHQKGLLQFLASLHILVR